MAEYCGQRTPAAPVVCSGVGVHSGRNVNITIKPAPENYGIKFVRKDLPDSPSVPALFKMVIDTSLATVIGYHGVIVSTVEHLMAALAGLGIDNAIVELDSYEMPIMDGSAAQFTTLIRQVGIVEQEAPRYFFEVLEPIELQEGGKSVVVYPSAKSMITCIVEYRHPLIGRQSMTIEMNDVTFEKEISSARTFGFLQDVETMRRFGLARGGSLNNAVVLDREHVVNEEGLRFEDEFVRHKLLDCIGDFALLGMPILGHIVAKRSGHAFHHAFLQEFFNQKGAWQTRPLKKPSACIH